MTRQDPESSVSPEISANEPNELRSHRLTRRTILRAGVSLAAAASVTSLLAACGGDDDDAPAVSTATATASSSGGMTPTAATSGSATETATQSPAATTGAATRAATTSAGEGVQGGSLKVAVAGEPNSMDQHVGSARNNEVINNNIYDRLVEAGDDGEFYPGLVETWEVDSEGLTWTLQVKQGVLFHDGTAFDSSVVKHNFDRIIQPDTKSQKAAGLLGPYGGSEVLDPTTVEVTMTEPYAPFVDALASHYLVMQSPAAIEQYGPDYSQHPVGTGPFMFKEWIPQDHMTLVKNPDYQWAPEIMGRQGPPYLDEIVYRFITEEATRVTTLETGESDLITTLPTQDFDRVNSDDRFTVLSAPILGQAPGLIINVEKPPTDDVNVRRALQHAVDQDTLIETVFYGVYERAYSALTQYNLFYDSSLEGTYPYDPEQSMQILEDGGWVAGSDGIREKDGRRLHLVFLVFPTGSSNLVGEFVQAQLRDIGVEVELLQLQNPANLASAQAGEHNIRWLSWYFSDPGQLNITFHTSNIGTGWNFTRFRSQELDDLLDQGQRELDPAKRAEIYSQIQHMILDEALLVPLYVITEILAMRQEVKGVRLHPLGGEPMFYNTYIEE